MGVTSEAVEGENVNVWLAYGRDQSQIWRNLVDSSFTPQTGIPVIYSGDEIAQLNDYSYHEDPSHWDDSRYVHRGKFDFALAGKRLEKGTVQQEIFWSSRRS